MMETAVIPKHNAPHNPPAWSPGDRVDTKTDWPRPKLLTLS